jgi:peptide/nickel transport system permease protein
LKGESRLPLPPGRYVSGNYYILGTDAQGHDIWTWLVYGSRVAFLVGITAAFMQVVIGSLYGVISGFKGGWVDTVMMRFADIMLTLPFLPIILILTSIVGRSLWNIIFVLGIFGWAGISRVIRAQTLSLKNRPFVDAALVAGASGWRIMISHILPNVLPFAFLYMTLGVAGAILSEAALSFLGLGDPQAVSWGQMLSTIQTSGATMYAWWWLLPPGLAITLISLGFYLVGRAFDEILNPRLRKR